LFNRFALDRIGGHHGPNLETVEVNRRVYEVALAGNQVAGWTAFLVVSG